VTEGTVDSICRLLVFRLDGQRYGVDLAATVRVLPMVAFSRLPGSPPIVLGALNLHGELTPVLDIRRRLGLRAVHHDPEDRLLVALAGGRTVALPVDEVVGVVEVPRENVVAPGEIAADGAHVEGVAMLEDGLLLIEDLDAFLSDAEEQALAASFEEAGE
jgi:purine-binding chemotaxis protein CheW